MPLVVITCNKRTRSIFYRACDVSHDYALTNWKCFFERLRKNGLKGKAKKKQTLSLCLNDFESERES